MARLPDTKERKEKIAKLPEWVRLYIAKLESDVRYYQTQAQSISEGTSRLSWAARHDEPDVFLPEHATVTMVVGGRAIHINPDFDRNIISVRSDSGYVFVKPDAANALTLFPEEKNGYTVRF